MDAIELYTHLERDFISKELKDDRARYMSEVEDYLCLNFKDRSMELVCDSAKKINKVSRDLFCVRL